MLTISSCTRPDAKLPGRSSSCFRIDVFKRSKALSHRVRCHHKQLDQPLFSATFSQLVSHRPTFDQCHHRNRHMSMQHQKGLDPRRVVTKAATLTAPNLSDTDIWQWRKHKLQKIVAFTGPALSIPLADPIMSLVDTVCIGQVWSNILL